MALSLDNMRGQVRSELRVSKSELPDTLLKDYVNNVQKEVAQMLGPVVGPILRKRIDLTGTATTALESNAAGTFTYSTQILTGFLGLTPSAEIGKEIVFWGTFTTIGLAVFKDIISANDATTITVEGNSRTGYNATGCWGIIFGVPGAVDPLTTGFYLPEDCMVALYLSDYSDPDVNEEKISIIQIDDTEQFVNNEYWATETKAAFVVGDAIHIIKGGSSPANIFPKNLAITYIRRPVDYSATSDTAEISKGRLPEEFWGIIRAGVLKLSAMHLRRTEVAAYQGEDMASRISIIQNSWGLSDKINQREVSTN